MKIVYLVGNLLLSKDNKPLLLQKKLQKKFPNIKFLLVDPNENFVPDDNSIIIDTVLGIDKVTFFQSIETFAVNKLISPHDYDLGWHLQFLKKLGKINNIRIIGIPPNVKFNHLLNKLVELFT